MKHKTNPWLSTRCGKRLHVLDPHPEEIEIGDIAAGLTNRMRWCGQTKYPYSVAQHSLAVAGRFWVEPDFPPIGRHCMLALWGLLHDAAEAYLPDVPRPIKPLLHFCVPEGRCFRPIPFVHVENGILAAVAQRFELPWPIPAEVFAVDDRELAREARDLCANTDGVELRADPDPYPEPVLPRDSTTVYRQFVAAFLCLHDARQWRTPPTTAAG